MTQGIKIGFIGGGNMATSLIGGLIADGIPADTLYCYDPSQERQSQLREQFAIHISPDNPTLIGAVDVVVLAVKPQLLSQVCQEIAAAVQARQPLLVSIAAGIRSEAIERWLGGNVALVRTMPNTPSLVQSGATALYANARVNAEQREQAEGILRAVGLSLWLDDEVQMDAVTALSGSGPAYLFLVMEAMEKAGIELGLPAETARLLSLQTAFGAAKMALESSESSAVLRERVTSPGGTTERALGVFQEANLIGLFEDAMRAARDRSRELADMLGQA